MIYFTLNFTLNKAQSKKKINSKNEGKKIKEKTLQCQNTIFKVDNWFLIYLKTEYFHYNQLKVQVVQIEGTG